MCLGCIVQGSGKVVGQMWRYFGIKLVLVIPTLLGVCTLVFLSTFLIPGDAAQAIAGPTASKEVIENIRHELGLDEPFAVQYGRFIGKAAKLDFGRSFKSNERVSVEIQRRFPNSIILTLLAALISVVIGIPLGVIAATKRYSVWDGLAMLISLLGISMPSFWLGLLLMYLFSVRYHLLPSFGFDTPAHVILPSVTLASFGIAYVARYTRSSMLEILKQDYITAVRARGLPARVILYRHALKNAIGPVITIVGLGFGYMLGGTVVIETVFSINGIGKFLVDSIFNRDIAAMQGAVFVVALSFVLVNLAVDLLYAFFDPRVRYD